MDEFLCMMKEKVLDTKDIKEEMEKVFKFIDHDKFQETKNPGSRSRRGCTGIRTKGSSRIHLRDRTRLRIVTGDNQRTIFFGHE